MTYALWYVLSHKESIPLLHLILRQECSFQLLPMPEFNRTFRSIFRVFHGCERNNLLCSLNFSNQWMLHELFLTNCRKGFKNKMTFSLTPDLRESVSGSICIVSHFLKGNVAKSQQLHIFCLILIDCLKENRPHGDWQNDDLTNRDYLFYSIVFLYTLNFPILSPANNLIINSSRTNLIRKLNTNFGVLLRQISKLTITYVLKKAGKLVSFSVF